MTYCLTQGFLSLPERWSRKLRRDMMESPGLTCFRLEVTPSASVAYTFR